VKRNPARVDSYQKPVCFYYGTNALFVILNALKNLVPHQDVVSFSWDYIAVGSVLIWVLKDEILHCVQNDKGKNGRNARNMVVLTHPV
jgi:hypothetical protein